MDERFTDICTNTVDLLCGDTQLVEFLGEKRIYQLVAPSAEEFPRIVIAEDFREYTLFADDVPIQERCVLRFDLYAKENELVKLASLSYNCLNENGYIRRSVGTDTYLNDFDVFMKTLTFETYIEIEN